MPRSRIDIWPVTKDVLVRWNLRLPDPNLGNVSISMVLVLEVTVSVNEIGMCYAFDQNTWKIYKNHQFT